MKKLLNKIKVSLATLWIAIISFSSKALADINETFSYAKRSEPVYEPQQSVYGVPNTMNPINSVLNAIQRLTAIAIFIIGIVNLIRIIRTNDKNLKKKRIKNTIIVISILIIILIACFVVAYLLKR